MPILPSTLINQAAQNAGLTKKKKKRLNSSDKVVSTWELEGEIENEQGRWQKAIYALLVDRTAQGLIGGGGCDSGDPLDFTLAEISQGLAYHEDQNCDLRTQLADLRKKLGESEAKAEIPFDDEIRWILGQVCYMCRDYAKLLIASGKYEGKSRAEDEQAVAIHWMLSLYLKHGPEKWRDEGRKELDELRQTFAKAGLGSLTADKH